MGDWFESHQSEIVSLIRWFCIECAIPVHFGRFPPSDKLRLFLSGERMPLDPRLLACSTIHQPLTLTTLLAVWFRLPRRMISCIPVRGQGNQLDGEV